MNNFLVQLIRKQRHIDPKEEMTYQGRALYNLLQMNLKHDPSIKVQEWQVEMYRHYSLEELFHRLETMEIFLDQDNFLLYVDECDSPEDLTHCLALEEGEEKKEQIFLIVFELWRRLAPHKQTLSLFVDELDHLIERYEEGDIEGEEDLQGALESFQRILDDHVDEGGEPKEGYRLFSAFSCHDLEVFLFEYIAHHIDVENETYASQLLDGFYPYMVHERWFDFLRIRLVNEVDLNEGKGMLQRLLISLKETPELQLLFEILHYLISIEEKELFQIAYFQVIGELKTEKDLQELLLLTADYFHAMEREEEETFVNKLLEEKKQNDPQILIHSSDKALQTLKDLVTSLGLNSK